MKYSLIFSHIILGRVCFHSVRQSPPRPLHQPPNLPGQQAHRELSDWQHLIKQIFCFCFLWLDIQCGILPVQNRWQFTLAKLG